MIAYPKVFREKIQEPKKSSEAKVTSKESVEVWKALTNETWELAMSNYYFETWMWQFKKVPASITKLNKLVSELSEKKTAEIMETELRTKLDYLQNAKEMIEVAESRVEDTLRTIWAKKRELG